MLIVLARAEVSAQNLEALKSAAAVMTLASNAEPGCIAYSFNIDLAAPHLVRIVEVWQDQAALDAHFKTPHMAAFQTAIAGKINLLGAEKYETPGPQPLFG